MDKQDGQDKRLAHADTTRRIIGCAMQVINELGSGFLESVYEKAMTVALTDDGVSHEVQQPIDVRFRGRTRWRLRRGYPGRRPGHRGTEGGHVNSLTGEHEAQVINYLNATGIPVGLLINFGKPKLEFKRFTRTRKTQN